MSECMITSPGYKKGDYVYIGYGTYKGFIGSYYSCFPIPYSEGYTTDSMIELIMHTKNPTIHYPRGTCEIVKIHDSCFSKIDLSQLQEGYNSLCTGKNDSQEIVSDGEENQLDFIGHYLCQFLDNETMRSVARQIFQVKMNRLFDQVYDARIKSCGMSLYDEIMKNMTDRCIEKFKDELDGVFMKRVEQEILRTDHPEEGDQTFREWLRFRLQREGDDWITAHKQEVADLMQDHIQLAAAHLSEDELCKKMGKIMEDWLKDKF